MLALVEAVLGAFFAAFRPRASLVTRELEPRELGKVIALPRVGGLHHRYVRRAA
jgi:hypothetical protein